MWKGPRTNGVNPQWNLAFTYRSPQPPNSNTQVDQTSYSETLDKYGSASRLMIGREKEDSAVALICPDVKENRAVKVSGNCYYCSEEDTKWSANGVTGSTSSSVAINGLMREVLNLSARPTCVLKTPAFQSHFLPLTISLSRLLFLIRALHHEG